MADRRENDSPESQEATIGAICRHYAAALLSGDEVAAEVAIREAIDAKLTTAQIDDEIIAPALWLVGDLWQRGEISVADEHLATEISLRVLALQREALRTRRGTSRPSGHAGDPGRRAAHRRAADERQPPARGGLRDRDARRRRAATIARPLREPPRARRDLPELDDGRRRRPDRDRHPRGPPGAPGAAFVLGGRAITSRLRSRPGIAVCDRISEVVEAVDALAKRADTN